LEIAEGKKEKNSIESEFQSRDARLPKIERGGEGGVGVLGRVESPIGGKEVLRFGGKTT